MNKSALEQLEDSELVVLCRRDAEGAFDTLYHRYRLPLFSYIHRMMQNNSSAAEDIFQQTWIKAVRNLGAYQERQRFFAWLCRISHNLIMDFYRSRRNFFGEELPDTLAAPVFCEDDFLETERLHEAVRQAITELPEEQRAVVMMRRDGISFKEIAVRQKISINTALGRMHYAVQRIRRILGCNEEK